MNYIGFVGVYSKALGYLFSDFFCFIVSVGTSNRYNVRLIFRVQEFRVLGFGCCGFRVLDLGLRL